MSAEELKARLAKIAELLEKVDDERGRQWFMDEESTINFNAALKLAKGEQL